MNDTTFNDILVIRIIKNAPTKANGNEKIMINGFLKDSNKQARIIINKTNEIINAIINPLNASVK